MSDTKDAQNKLRLAAVDYCLSLERGIVDDEQLAEEDLRQAARDFAAAEVEARPPTRCQQCGRMSDDHNVRHMFVGGVVDDCAWLRAGGLAGDVGGTPSAGS